MIRWENAKATPIACGIPGVTANRRRWTSRVNSQKVEERLYKCANGLALGLRRGGTYSDWGRWEAITIDPAGVPITRETWPTPVFIDHDEAYITRLVTRLASWFERVPS